MELAVPSVEAGRDLRYHAVELLRLYKGLMKYREIAELVKIPPPAIWRYITLKIMPSYERAEDIVRALTSRDVVSSILKKYVRFKENAIDISNVFNNVMLLKVLAYLAYYNFSGSNVDVVLTVELDGVPIATLVADLFKSRLAISRKGIPFTSDTVYEAEYISRDPPSIVRLYLPSSDLRKNERVLIVDDIVRTGKTTATLIKLIRSIGATLIGVFSPIAVGSLWRETLRDYLDVIVTVLNIEERIR
ncbi:MAG: phosphoribosyltransferase family protein [Sulfolobales archaeon]|nr:phosphoribosyltransferase family protein [Sulfolobales archaeon]MCX8208938.1 phosphoribosyltransferase family protein [Sulfolobales archaeon]